MGTARPIDVEELLRIARRYHPLGILDSDPGYADSPEVRARGAVQQAAAADAAGWSALLAAAREALPASVIEDWTHLHLDVCRRARVYLPGAGPGASVQKAIVVCASVIAPLYLLYESHLSRVGEGFSPPSLHDEPTAEGRSTAEIVAQIVEQQLGVERLDAALAATPVPGIGVGNVLPGEATLADALFTDNRW